MCVDLSVDDSVWRSVEEEDKAATADKSDKSDSGNSGGKKRKGKLSAGSEGGAEEDAQYLTADKNSIAAAKG